MENVVVSVICNTYNHEKYIEKCLNGFVNQKTNFLFEILIHDDASTDNTASIIKEFENKYPNIIKPIYQKENQYSKGLNITMTFQYPRVRGEYIAFCEGDDYWTDKYKLQKQVDALNNHPEVDICSHGANVMTNGRKKCTITPKNKDCIIDVEEVIYGGGGFVATNSLLYRSNIIKNPPDFFKHLHMDYTLQIYGSLRGGMLYLSNIMSVYNYMTPESWSIRTLSSRTESQKVVDKLSKMLLEFNFYSEGKYESIILDYILKLEFIYLLKVGPFKKIRDKRYKKYKKQLNFKSKMLMIIKELFPSYFEKRLKNKQTSGKQ